MVHNIVSTYISFHLQFNIMKTQWVVAQKRLFLSKYSIRGRFFPQETLLLPYQTTKSIKSLKIVSSLILTSIFQRKLLYNCDRPCKTDYLKHELFYSSSRLCFVLFRIIFGHPRETIEFVHR